MSTIQALNVSIFIELDKIIIITTIFEVISYRNNKEKMAIGEKTYICRSFNCNYN